MEKTDPTLMVAKNVRYEMIKREIIFGIDWKLF